MLLHSAYTFNEIEKILKKYQNVIYFKKTNNSLLRFLDKSIIF
jgi:hypothetical protein